PESRRGRATGDRRHRRDRRGDAHHHLHRRLDRLTPVRVLVLGGTEFISIHLVRALTRAGDDVAVLDRGRRAERLPAGVKTIVCDRKDHAAVRKALDGVSVDGLVDVTYAPTTGEDVEAVLDALDGRLGHALFVSTCRVYDHARPIPFDETTPRNLY